MGRHIVIIGGGPAGIEAARAAASAGQQVTLINEGPLGGRAGWDSLLPSKVWITDSTLFHLLHMAPHIPFEPTELAPINPTHILNRIQQIAQQWSVQQAELLERLNVAQINGVATIAAPNRVVVTNAQANHTTLEADAIIVATGSVPRFPEGMRPDGRLIIAPRFASRLETIPESVLVVGGGATGSEFAHLFQLVGSQVTWIVGRTGVLPEFPSSVGQAVAAQLVNRGVQLVSGQRVSHMEREDVRVTAVLHDETRLSAALAFLAVGRVPDLSRLNIAEIGLSPNERGGMAVDGYGRTAIPSIYLVGDAAGEPMLANRATAQAWVAGRHAAGVPVAPFRAETVVHAVYTDPEAAMVGTIDANAPNQQQVSLPFSATLKSYLQGEGEGTITLVYDATNRRICGGFAVGSHAAEVLSPVALAVQTHATLDDLAATAGAHPTFSELAFLAARQVI